MGSETLIYSSFVYRQALRCECCRTRARHHPDVKTIHNPLLTAVRGLIFHFLIPHNDLNFHLLRPDIRIAPAPLPLLMLKLRHLLLIHLSMLQQHRLLRDDVRLPRQRPDILGPQRVREHLLHLLQRLPRRLREREEHVHQHRQVEHAEDDVRLPLDVDERGRDEVAEGEVEGPVRRGGERDGFAADAQGVEFRRVDPGDRAPAGGVGCDEEVRTSNNSLRRRARNLPRGFGSISDALGARVVAV